MNARDSFTKIVPTYHHAATSGYQASHSHRSHAQINNYIEGNCIRNKNLQNHHKKDFIKNYSESMWVLGKDFAPEPRKQLKNGAGDDWKINVMHSLWPINSIYHGRYQSGELGIKL